MTGVCFRVMDQAVDGMLLDKKNVYCNNRNLVALSTWHDELYHHSETRV